MCISIDISLFNIFIILLCFSYFSYSRYLTPKKEDIKYEEPLAQLGRVEHVKYQFVPFTISLFGNIGPSGLHFFENFKKVLLNRSSKTMNSTFWSNKIVFCIFKSIPTMISKALLAIGVEYERSAVSRFSNNDASTRLRLSGEALVDKRSRDKLDYYETTRNRKHTLQAKVEQPRPPQNPKATEWYAPDDQTEMVFWAIDPNHSNLSDSKQWNMFRADRIQYLLGTEEAKNQSLRFTDPLINRCL
ncbi:hypothetical protein P9112_008397 [Eukaryota sp. TZLM1-RC]